MSFPGVVVIPSVLNAAYRRPALFSSSSLTVMVVTHWMIELENGWRQIRIIRSIT